MYEFVDRPVTSLDSSTRFLIWAMRSWAKSINEKRCPCNSIGPAFAQLELLAGLPHFHMMMMILSCKALERFRFAQPRCNRIGEHEALILSFVYTTNTRRMGDLQATLARVVRDQWLPDLVTAVESFGCAMARADILPVRPTIARRDTRGAHE